MSRIHPSAVIDPSVKLGENVEIGPFCVIGPDVTIGSGTKLASHVVISGPSIIGSDNYFYQFSSIGENPQDKKYQSGDQVQLIMGDRNTIREFVTINRGTIQDNAKTQIGDDNWIMANCHIAHDCIVGSRTVFANGASLAGHVIIGDDVILGGYSMIYQRCRIGQSSITGFSSGIHRDVPPFITAAGYRGVPAGINSEGLRRKGFSPEDIMATKSAYRSLYRKDLGLEAALLEISTQCAQFPHLQILVDFLNVPTERGIIRGSDK
ncbi:UDP-N-acetylglucosamine acetyltransferase [Gammaproteobacteria bacterium]|nr:UDP-N-acetylglucosamine acetyltransferase [Gammaproteobacteria bacterium]